MEENVYQSPEADLATPEQSVQYVGFWTRFLASVVDTIWMYGIIYVFLYMVIGAEVFNPQRSFNPLAFLMENIVPIIVVMAFWLIKSATPGKMILKAKIVDAETLGKVPPGRLFLRYIGYFISMLPLFLGFFWVAWDEKKQGWHDKIAKTVIIKE